MGGKKRLFQLFMKKSLLLDVFLIFSLTELVIFGNISCFNNLTKIRYKISMFKIYQQTISKPIILTGKGLHTGRSCAIKILPAEADQGIIFKRTDLDKNNIINASYKNVSSAKLCTTLENEFGVKVSTVEHLLAAFYISGIDNVIVEIDSEEVPIMDGSAVIFVNEIQKQNLKELSKKRKY